MIELCTWCGHEPHDGPCDRTVMVGGEPDHGRKVANVEQACPCARRS